MSVVMTTPFLEDSKTSIGEHLAHIINPPNNLHIWFPGMSSQDIVKIARENNIEVVALCGYIFVPKQNPEPLDACTTCIDIAGELMRSKGE